MTRSARILAAVAEKGSRYAGVAIGQPCRVNASRDHGSNNSPQQSPETRKGEVERNGKTGLPGGRPCLFLAAENRLLREALAGMLTKRGGFEVIGLEDSVLMGVEPAEIMESCQGVPLLFVSRGPLHEDLAMIRRVRSLAPTLRIVLIGAAGDEVEFLQYVRAGISGYLLRDASAEDVLAGVRAVQAGEAVCPGAFCAALFRFFEREATSFPSAALHRELGLTRREQQMIPLIARGMTNKEIANHFCLSEQTIKNHLYRMKQKIGAGDRLGIVQLCHQQGFLA